MAKRGETRPWRVRFEWENGVRGVDTFATEDRATDYAEMLRRHAGLRDTTVKITIEERPSPMR